jgi:hypothetical protein
MPLGLRRGTVSAITEELPGLVRLEVDGIACVAYPRLTGAVEVGDDVLVNEQARLLQLGSGGFDVLYANLTRGLGLPAEEGAHVMALPYTPGQLALRRAEEDTELPTGLDGMPVVLCTVHSQVAPVCAALSGKRAAYVQVQGGALPVSLSDTVRALKHRGLLGAAIAVAPCLDGDFECVSLASAFALAKHQEHDVIVCSVGPGIVGTGTRLGTGALALADAVTMASILGGSPILAPRVSEADPRDRHRGMSHHTRTVGELSVGKLTQSTSHRPDLEVWREACAGLPLSHMGRGPDEDAAFFRAAFAAGLTARDMLG